MTHGDNAALVSLHGVTDPAVLTDKTLVVENAWVLGRLVHHLSGQCDETVDPSRLDF